MVKIMASDSAESEVFDIIRRLKKKILNLLKQSHVGGFEPSFKVKMSKSKKFTEAA